MKIDIIMSTMNRNKIEELCLKEKKIIKEDNITIINQSVSNHKMFQNLNHKMLTFNEKGISKSRNRGILNSIGDICIITDDDVIFVENYKEIIMKAYDEYPEADIITFRVKTPSGEEFKRYPKKIKHNIFSLLKVSSIEITFKKQSIMKSKVFFNEKFGLGTSIPLGEENIFLNDCLNKKLKIYHYPEIIVIHPKETSCTKLDSENLYNKGKFVAEVFKSKYFIINFLFILKKKIAKEITINFFDALRNMNDGSKRYLKYNL